MDLHVLVSDVCLLHGSRAQGDRVGVYMYRHREWAAGSYSHGVDLFGDRLYWFLCLEIVGDYEQRVTPTERKQIVLPQAYERNHFIWSLRKGVL